MSFNYDKLRGKIVEKFKTQGAFAEAMGLSERTISLKLNNKIFFTQLEIKTAAELLDIKISEIEKFFFTDKVQELEQKKKEWIEDERV